MKRRGFTVIELLVVIGIITIVATFLFYAYNHVIGDRKVSDTKTAMEGAKALLANYEEATHYRRPMPIVYSANTDPAWTTAVEGLIGTAATNWQLQFWTGGYTGSGEPAAGGLNSIFANNGPGMAASVYPTQMADTICAMYALESIPENATIINNLPTNLKKTIQVSQVPPGTDGFVANLPVTLILDGWGNPILFAPADGIYSVITSADALTTLNGTYQQGQSVIFRKPTSSAAYTYTSINPVGAGTVPPAPPPTAIYPTKTDPNWGGLCDPTGLRPFFVSGGPDGDISNARGDPSGANTKITHDDDNVYSFGN